MEPVQLKDRDFVFVVDSSGSMGTKDQTGGRSRWESAAEAATALARKAATYDPDGLTVYTFAGKHRRFDNVTDSAQVARIFEEVEPNGSTNLDGVLTAIFSDFQKRKKAGELKPNGEIAVVVTDGSPDDQSAVKKAITSFSNLLDRDEEYGILFVQVGNDQGARHFLKQLDDDLKDAKFDIVDTLTMDELGDKTLTEALAGAISD
jgi:uncharacterized protein (DUF58 family)